MKTKALRIASSLAFALVAASFFCGCGGSSKETQYEFPENTSLVISIGPAQSASPADVEGVPVNLDRAWTLVFRSGAGLNGVVSSNGGASQNCVYSVRGDVYNGEYDLDISWGSLSDFPEYVSLKGVKLKTGDVNGTAAEWSTGRDVATVVGEDFVDSYITFMGVNATVTWGP